MAGRLARRTSVMATGRNATGTQLTHAKCAESTRWIAWGSKPRLKTAIANKARAVKDVES
jgi:hypothetical protein